MSMMHCGRCGWPVEDAESFQESGCLGCALGRNKTPDTPELDLALALATCIGALQAQELPHDDASKALWRWRNARGMTDWPTVEGATTAPDDVLEAEVVA